jgi:hypothetical protein
VGEEEEEEDEEGGNRWWVDVSAIKPLSGFW